MYEKKSKKGGPHKRVSEMQRDALLNGYLNPAMHENLRRVDNERKKRKYHL